MWRFCCGAYTNVHKCELLSLAAAERNISFRFSKSCVALAREAAGRCFFYFLLMFRTVFLLFSTCFCISGLSSCSPPAGNAEQAAARVRYALFTYFFPFFQTTGGVDKLLHVPPRAVSQKKTSSHCFTPNVCYHCSNKYCNLRRVLAPRVY